MIYLHKLPEIQHLLNLCFVEMFISLSQRPKPSELAMTDTALILLGKQKLINPKMPALGQDNSAMTILIQTLLPNTAAQIIGLAAKHLAECLPQFRITYPSFTGCVGKIPRFEQPELHKASLPKNIPPSGID